MAINVIRKMKKKGITKMARQPLYSGMTRRRLTHSNTKLDHYAFCSLNATEHC